VRVSSRPHYMLLTTLFASASLLMSTDTGFRPRVPEHPAAPQPAPAIVSALKSAYGHLPMYFEPNDGQFDPKVRYVARGAGTTLALTGTDVLMVFSRAQRSPVDHPRGIEAALNMPEPQELQQSVVRMKLVGAKQPAGWTPLEKLPGISNYFIGNDPSKWRSNVLHYAGVETHGVYNGIDLVCHGTQGQFEYDLQVAPGADPSQIQLAWDGVDSLKLNAEGDLLLTTQLGVVVQKRPLVYQEVDGMRVEIGATYALAAGKRVRFQLASYDRSRALLIDPVVLAYSSLFGGYIFPNGIAVDATGSAYVAGYAAKVLSGPVPPDETAIKGHTDAFVAKLAPGGNELVYSTYIGGSSNDVGESIALDATGSAYVAGYTNSADFPTQSPYQGSYRGGNWDAFVTKLTPAGNALAYSTYLGGSGDEFGLGIAADAAGSAYIFGETSSSDFPTQSPYQIQPGSLFLTKLAPSGNALVYSTYLGGVGVASTFPGTIAVDAMGSAYVTGATGSSNFPALPPVSLPQNYGGVFVTKLALDGGSLVYSTVVGSGIDNDARGIAVDAKGSAYITGRTGGVGFPTVNPYQATYGGGEDAFVTKLTPAGDALVYSTFLGGSDYDEGYGIAVDAAGSAYVTGETYSTNFPTLSPYQASNGQNVFVTKLTPDGSQLVWSTYLGGGVEMSAGLAIDPESNAYVTGYTSSTTFPTVSSIQAFRYPPPNAFVTKFPATLPEFNDVSAAASYFNAANFMFAAGVTDGCVSSTDPSTRQFCPDNDVTREEMAAFIVRAVTGTPSPMIYNPTPYFTDVDKSNLFFPHIQKLKELGVTSGCSQTLFCPTAAIPRWEMAMLIVRARLSLNGAGFSFSPTPNFADVPTDVEGNGQAFPFIQRSYEEHATNGCGTDPLIYCPDALVTRGEMASFIMRGLFNETMVLPFGAPLLTGASPNTMVAGQGSSIIVTITGVNTNFQIGDAVTVPSGMLDVSNVVVNSGTSISATLTANGATVAGPQALVVTTGDQNLTLPLAIKVGSY
jgi:hypothetical protein